MTSNFTSIFNIKPEVITKKYYLCPGCGKTDHEYSCREPGQTYGPWDCDECGRYYRLEIQSDGTPMLCEVDGKKRIKYFSVLHLTGTTLRLVIESSTTGEIGKYDGQSEDDDYKYYWEENTCPVNFLGNAWEVEFDGETDPHGVFEVVATFLDEDDARQYLMDNQLDPGGTLND